MKVLVIGGAGYIGSHVVKELMKAQHRVTVFDNLSTGQLQNLFDENDFIAGDILYPETLDKAFEKGFDAFIHLAAFKAAGESMIAPEKYSINNISGSLNIMNAALKHNCKYMVFSSTAAVFGSPQYLPIDEKHLKNPENYYGFTKLEIENFMSWYDKLKGLKYAALRYFNAKRTASVWKRLRHARRHLHTRLCACKRFGGRSRKSARLHYQTQQKFNG